MDATNSAVARIAGVGLLLITSAGAYTPPSAAVSALDKYRGFSELTTAAGSDLDTYTKNLVTWQMDHGGFCKAYADKYKATYDGKTDKCSWTANGVALGTFDNNATIQEMRFLATRYKATTDATLKATIKASFTKAIGFVLVSQHSAGSWPQVHPKRGNYSDMATYNDNAMTRVMVLVKDIVDKKAPFDSDIISAADVAKLKTALDKAVEFALKAQILNGGVPTVWCAQHDPATYKPVGARSYELASKSGSESAGIVWFLMNWPDQTAAIQKAAKGALVWYRKNRVADLKFSSGNFVATPGAAMWYRFYEVDTDAYFFCDRDGESTKTQDITKLSEDRRTGYQWAGDYGTALLNAEKAYLDALGSNPVAVEARPSNGPAVRLAEGRAILRLAAEGPLSLRWYGTDGAQLASETVQATGGDVAAKLPSGTGLRFLVVSSQDGSELGRHAIVIR